MEERRAAESRDAAQLSGGLLSLGLDVLVVDDNVINREVAQAMLERVGCSVTVAEDGIAALEHANRRGFDAILMDCQMPGMDGYAATAAIRRIEADRGSRATPIVALTANVLARDRNRCIEAGMNYFLSKPFTQDQMVAVLRPIAQQLGKLVLLAATEATKPVQPERPAGTQRAERPVASPRPSLAPKVPQAARMAAAADSDLMELDFQTGRDTAATVPRLKILAPAVADEPLLSDTAVFGMLEFPAERRSDLDSVPMLDASQVAAIRGLGKPKVFERLCELLFTTAPESLQRLEAALEAGDLQAIAAAAHSFKSPVSSLGGRRLAAQLEQCELAALEARDVNEARRAARGMKQTYAILEAALRVESSRATGT